MSNDQFLLEAVELRKSFHSGGGAFAESGAHNQFTAVDNVSFQIVPGETFAIVGESGCGKTTLARMLLRLIEPDGGKIIFEGRDLLGLSAGAMRRTPPNAND